MDKQDQLASEPHQMEPISKLMYYEGVAFNKGAQTFNIALHYHVDYMNHFLGTVIILQNNYKISVSWP